MNGWKPILLAALLPALAFAQQPGTPADQPEKPANPPRPPDAARASRGKAVYQRFCFSCHGENVISGGLLMGTFSVGFLLFELYIK